MARDSDVQCTVLGGGSNVLVSDSGVRGLVILNRAKTIRFFPAGEWEEQKAPTVRVESGASLSTVARQSVARGLAGLEWAVGIPGTVGGAIIGNAGAWGSDIAATLNQATVLEENGAVIEWPVERFEYGYRTSVLKQEAGDGGRQKTILEAEFALEQGEPKALEARVAEIGIRRKESQPPGPTCGSVFKNPPGDYAGRLIEAAGLKGQRRGEAEISTKHANFVVNHGSATATEVKALIDLAREAVLSEFGVRLELEIELMGERPDAQEGNGPVL
jgi:UDP-N-acetylmuramate dehydrogenase